MTKRTFLVTLVTLGLIIACNPPLACADTIFTYSYSGPSYTYVDPYYVGAHLSMTLSLSTLLSSSTLADVTPLFWSLSDGKETFTSTDCETDSCSMSFRFASDTHGNVTAWNVKASISNSSPAMRFSVSYYFSPCPNVCGDQVDSVSYTDATVHAYASLNHNVVAPPWVGSSVPSTPVPEPASLSSLLLGLARLAYRLRKNVFLTKG